MMMACELATYFLLVMRSRFKYIVLSMLVSSFCAYSRALDVAVVKTRSLPTVDRLLSGFQSACQAEHNITVYDMKGSAKQGQKILAQIEQRAAKNIPQTVLALGLPAAKLIDQSSLSADLFFAMINNPYSKSGITKNIPGFSQTLPANKLLERVSMALPGVNKVAIIHSKEVSSAKIEGFTSAANDLGLVLNSYFITSMKDLPDSLMNVIKENDALLLIPDRNVINQHSIEFLVNTAITETFPIIGYNEHLVKAGLMVSISPDYAELGKTAGDLICNQEAWGGGIRQPNKAAITINVQAVKIIKPELSAPLQGIADHVY